MEHENLTGCIIGGAMKVHRVLAHGYLEVVYKNALAHELRALGMAVDSGRRIQVRYEDVVVGEFVCDMLVEETVLVEIKAVRVLAPAHEAQLVNYLTATGIEIGLLLNFGAERLEFRRKTRTYRPARAPQNRQEERGQRTENRQADRIDRMGSTE